MWQLHHARRVAQNTRAALNYANPRCSTSARSEGSPQMNNQHQRTRHHAAKAAAASASAAALRDCHHCAFAFSCCGASASMPPTSRIRSVVSSCSHTHTYLC